MRLRFTLPLLALAGILAAAPVLADCIDDVPKLKARITRESDAAKAGAAKKQLAAAEKNVRGSESECRNAVTRAYRILNESSAEPAKLAPGQRRTEPEPGKPWNSIR